MQPLKQSDIICQDHRDCLLRNDPDNPNIDIYNILVERQKRIQVERCNSTACVEGIRIGILKKAGKKGYFYLHCDNGLLYYGYEVSKDILQMTLNRRFWRD